MLYQRQEKRAVNRHAGSHRAQLSSLLKAASTGAHPSLESEASR